MKRRGEFKPKGGPVLREVVTARVFVMWRYTLKCGHVVNSKKSFSMQAPCRECEAERI